MKQWVRLEVPASLVGLEGSSISGMAFTLFGGKASWDKSGKLGAGAGNIFQLLTSLSDGSGEAVAMNLTKQTNPFDVLTAENFGPDKRTRVALFAIGITGIAANTDPNNDVTAGGTTTPNFAESVTVEARLSNGSVVTLPVEFAGSQTAMIGFDQVVVRLAPELRDAGMLNLTLIVGGQRSNSATILIR